MKKKREITPYLDKICRVHGDRHPELFEINEHFNATAGELAAHMKRRIDFVSICSKNGKGETGKY